MRLSHQQLDEITPRSAAQAARSNSSHPATTVGRAAPGWPQPRRSRWLRQVFALAKTAVFALYLYSGYVALRDFLLARLGRARVIVLCYHRLGAPDVLTKSVDEFRRDLADLRRRYECLSLHELCERLRANTPFRRRAVVITFDDGYRDNYTVAAPALRAAGLTATFFVATGFIGTDRAFEHDAREGKDYPKLTWDDLRVMEAVGFEIGSHTINHANLGHADEAVMRQEIYESLDALNRELGAHPRAFAFPWGKPGDISTAAVRLAQQAGYYAALSAYGGAVKRGAPRFTLRRVDAGNGQVSRLAWRARVAGFDPDYFRLKFSAWF